MVLTLSQRTRMDVLPRSRILLTNAIGSLLPQSATPPRDAGREADNRSVLPARKIFPRRPKRLTYFVHKVGTNG